MHGCAPLGVGLLRFTGKLSVATRRGGGVFCQERLPSDMWKSYFILAKQKVHLESFLLYFYQYLSSELICLSLLLLFYRHCYATVFSDLSARYVINFWSTEGTCIWNLKDLMAADLFGIFGFACHSLG